MRRIKFKETDSGIVVNCSNNSLEIFTSADIGDEDEKSLSGLSVSKNVILQVKQGVFELHDFWDRVKSIEFKTYIAQVTIYWF